MKEGFQKINNIKYAFLITAARSGWFISSGWLFFWLRFLTYSEIGLVDGITVLIAFLLEIPFGAMADLIGRKKMLILSYIAMTIGPLLMATAQVREQLILGNFLFLVGFSAQSGAFDALAYDSLKEENKENLYSKYYATSSTISWVINAISLVIGGFAFNIDQRIPFFLWGFSYFCGLLLTFRLHEPTVEKIEKFSLKKYFVQNIDGLKELFSKYLIKFIPFTVIVLGFLYFYDWSFMRPAIGKENGLDGFAQSMIYAASSIPAAIVVQFIPFFKKRISDKWGAVILCVLLSSIYLTFAFPLGNFAAIPMILISTISALSFSWMIVIINEHVDTAHRATAVSSMYMLLKVPYVLLVILGGEIIQSGNIKWLNLAIAVVIFIAAIILGIQKVGPKNPK
jgi:MFS family permease